MKKRVFFVITSAIQIVVSVFAIMDAKNIAASLVEVEEIYSGDIGNRINDIYQNSGDIFVIILGIVGIILGFSVIYLAINDKLLKKKKTVITCNVFSCFLSFYQRTYIISIINIIVMAILKRERPEDFPDKVKPLPTIKKEKVTKKKYIFSIILVVFYFSQLLWKGFIPDEGILGIIIPIAFYIILIALSILAFYDLYKDNFKIYKKNFKVYLQNLMPKIGIFYLIFFALSIIVAFMARKAVSENQNALESLPLYMMIPLAVVYAPIVEEALFRGSLRRFIKNDKVFIVVSAITFGLLHTIFSETTLYSAIVMGIPYMAMGGMLAYLYVDTNNIFGNMSFHCFQNTCAVILMIIMKGF